MNESEEIKELQNSKGFKENIHKMSENDYNIIAEDIVEVGKSYQVYDNHYYRYHILAIVENMIVYRFYGKYKQYWHYGVISPYEIKWRMELFKKRNNKKE